MTLRSHFPCFPPLLPFHSSIIISFGLKVRPLGSNILSCMTYCLALGKIFNYFEPLFSFWSEDYDCMLLSSCENLKICWVELRIVTDT